MTLRPHRHTIPDDILALSHERDALRKRGKYDRADILKRQIEEAGYVIKDNPHGAHLVILPSIEVNGETYRTSRHLPSYLDSPDSCTFSVNILAHATFEQVQRCIESVLRFAGKHTIEVILVDNASQDELSIWAEALRTREPRLLIARTTRPLGEAEARNIGLKLSRGRCILLLDSSVELTGDIFTPLAATLADESIGITGWHGLHTDDLRHFEESLHTAVAAVDGTCLAFRRALLKSAGLLDERYRFARYMDIDFNFAVRATGARVVVTPGLPLQSHPALQDARLPDSERERLTKRNFYRFLEKWGDRDDLLDEDAHQEDSAP
ncbi:MAG: glycosyltransferase [Ktedonobacteraceae bacterium]|nr:glycosyltransferase [Ktedonobacteraceae bacterium]